jgi:glyoxylase-like metal-dependent hydrolase (beta-lactamase superfamily II)
MVAARAAVPSASLGSAAVSDDPYAPAVAAGIHRIAVPTPFAVGRVNVYLIEDDPLTLVDSGPNSGTSLDLLERELRRLGHAIEDLDRILVTHQHIDHIGLVQILAARSGAEVVALDRLVPFLEGYRDTAAAEDEFASATMLRHGVSEDVAQALRSVSLAYRGWGAGAQVSRALRDGETIAFAGRTLEACFRPGHSATDTVFLDRERRIAIGGDHLLKTISSNPLISRPLDGTERRRALIEYIDSLRATRAMDLDLVLPGHGDPIDDHRELIDVRLALHARRADKIHRLISERPRSAHEIAQTMWGDIAVTQAFLTLSEVLGHTDILIAEGRVVEQEDGDGHVVFRATPAAVAVAP